MEGYSLSRARCYRWLLGLVLLGRTVAQDNTQPTPEELACWEEYNGGAYYNPITSACEVCSAGQYDHDAIINMPNMNVAMVEGAMVITWWDGVTDWNPAATASRGDPSGACARWPARTAPSACGCWRTT